MFYSYSWEDVKFWYRFKDYALAIGLSIFSLGCYLNSFLTPESKFHELVLPQIVRGVSLMFCFLPTNNIALGKMSKDKVGNASGLYNLTRNLGGAVGLAVINTLLTDKAKIFAQYINENISASSNYAIMKMDLFKQLLEGRVIDAEKASYFLLASNINKQAFIMAINNIFQSISLLFIIIMLLLPFTSRADMKDDKMDAH